MLIHVLYLPWVVDGIPVGHPLAAFPLWARMNTLVGVVRLWWWWRFSPWDIVDHARLRFWSPSLD